MKKFILVLLFCTLLAIVSYANGNYTTTMSPEETRSWYAMEDREKIDALRQRVEYLEARMSRSVVIPEDGKCLDHRISLFSKEQ